MPQTPAPLPDFTRWPSFPFEGDIRVKPLEEPVDTEPPRKGEDAADCTACGASDDAYIWVSDRWRVRAMDRPTGLPMVLILESRSHLDLGDLPNMLAAELGVMTVRLEKAIRSLDGVARVHVNRWGDGEAHLHLWLMARPQGRLQLRGTFLSLWDEILPPVAEAEWRENLALVAAWLAEFGGTPLAEPPRIDWKAPAKFEGSSVTAATSLDAVSVGTRGAEDAGIAENADVIGTEGWGERASGRPANGTTANGATAGAEDGAGPAATAGTGVSAGADDDRPDDRPTAEPNDGSSEGPSEGPGANGNGRDRRAATSSPVAAPDGDSVPSGAATAST